MGARPPTVIIIILFVMPDYGLKVSKPGHDISEGDRYMRFTSKYPALKLKASGEGTASYTAGQGGTTVTIAHSLGYIPICFVYGEYFDVSSEAVIHRFSRWNRWIYQGVQVADYYYYYADSTNLYITFVASEGVTDAFSFDLDYMYHIFYDEDELS